MKSDFDWGIKATWCLTMAENDPDKIVVKDNYFIGIKKNKITYVGDFKPKLQKLSKRFIDAKNQLLMPGLINAHTHLPMTLLRGIQDDVPLKTWLFEKIFPLESKFVSKDFVKCGTELAALECIKFGTTCVADMYFYPEISASKWEDLGLRGFFSQCFMDHPLPEDKSFNNSAFDRFQNLFNRFKKSELITICLAPHAPYTCGDELLKKISTLSEETQSPIQIHLAESSHENSESINKYKETQVERLNRLGVLTSRTLCAHSVHLSKTDLQLFKKSGSHVVHNPDSNCKLGSGVAPIKKYFENNINVALGTDGAASANDLSLFGAMDLMAKLQKVNCMDSSALTAKQTLWSATRGGASALGLEDQIGSIEIGKLADLILVDYNLPHMQPVYDPISHLVYSANGSEVTTVFCNGKLLLKNGKYTNINQSAIFKNVAKWQKKIKNEISSLL